MTTPTQFEYCVPDAQTLADLYGVQLDLEQAIRFCDLHIEIDPTVPGLSTDEMMRREHTRQALCRAAFISYGRCFGSGARAAIDASIIGRLSAELQQRHTQVGDLRNKWVAHSVNHFDDVRVRIQATVDDDGTRTINGVSITANLVGTFLQAWMMAYRELFAAVLALVKVDLAIESTRLSEKVKTMPDTSLAKLKCVDNESLVHKSWDPHRSRGAFKVK